MILSFQNDGVGCIELISQRAEQFQKREKYFREGADYCLKKCDVTLDINSKVQWRTSKYEYLGDYAIPCVDKLERGYNQGSGIRRDSRMALMAKRMLWPLFKLFKDLLLDGFIERETGKLIRKYMLRETVFLGIGCGDMSLRKYISRKMFYNALDLEMSELHLRRILPQENVNIVLGSVTNIPAASNSVSMIVSTETFKHIPEIKKAMEEIYRVALPNGILICSIPNNFCYKYRKKGSHRSHVNSWTFEGFIKLMKSHGFEFVEGSMKGWWLPLPLWITRTSYQLAFSSKSEYYNTNFFYVFKAAKPESKANSASKPDGGRH